MHIAQNLIHKLTGREKAYFKKINNTTSEAKYMKLYDYLIENPDVTINDVASHFKQIATEIAIHVELNYLYQHLLRSLHIFHLKNRILTKLLSYAEILIQKKELTQASKVLLKLKKKAYQEEELEFILNAINLEGKIKDIAIIIRSKEDLNNEYQERLKIITEIQNITLLKKLKLELLNSHYNSIFNRTQTVDKVEGVEESLKSVQAIPFTTSGRDIWFSVNNLLCQSKKDFSRAQVYSLKRLQNIDSNIEKIDALDHLKAINNYLFVCILKQDYTAFNEKYIQLLSLKDCKGIPPHKFIYFKIYLRLAIEIKMNHLEALDLLVYDSLKETWAILDLLPVSEKNELLQFLASACILTNNYKEARKILVTWGRYKLKGYSFLLYKMNKMITFFAQGKYSLLKYEIENHKKAVFGLKHTPDILIHTTLISFFKKVMQQNSFKKEDVDPVIKEISLIKQKQQIVFDYYELNYVNWLEQYAENYYKSNPESVL